MRTKRRHATIEEDETRSDFESGPSTDLALRGVAQPAHAANGSQVNPYAPIYGTGALATTGGYPAHQSVAYNPYPGLPAHVADQLTPGLADRTGWALFQWMQDRHLLPGLGVLAGVGCGWGAAATEPMHPWFGSVFLGVGIAAGAVYSAIHVIRSLNGDDDAGPVPVGVQIIGLAGCGFTAFGTACITGLSYLSVGVTLLPAALGYYAWFQNRNGRLEGQRRFIVDYTAASTPALVPMPGTGVGQPAAIAGTVVSHEEAMVRRAFEGMNIALQDVYGFTRIDADSWAVTVVLAPAASVSPESIVSRRDVLTSALGANQLIALPTRRGHELRLTVRYGDIDPLAETVPFPGPVARSIAEPIPIAVAADASVGSLLLLGTHTLIGGATFGGKSVLLKTLVISLAALIDAVIWLIDLKPGRIELGIFEPIADRSARNIADAALMLEALVKIAEARGDYLAQLREETGQPVEQWDPAVHGPVLVVVFDEFAELIRQGRKVRKGEYGERIMEAIKRIPGNVETALQVYRALGIQIVMGTQSPDGSITAGHGKGGLDQIQNLVCVQTAKISQTNIILGPGAHGDGFCAHIDLYVRGMLYMRTPQVKIPIKYKGYFTPNDEIVAYIEQFAQTRVPLDDRSAEAAASVLGSAAATPRTGPGGGGGRPSPIRDAAEQRARPDLRSVPSDGYDGPRYPDKRPVEAKKQPLWNLLDSPQFRASGATVGELTASAVKAGHEVASLAWVRDRCKEWRELGYVVSEKEGQDNRHWRDDQTLAARFKKEA